VRAKDQEMKKAADKLGKEVRHSVCGHVVHIVRGQCLWTVILMTIPTPQPLMRA
jgi:hypothetical protein